MWKLVKRCKGKSILEVGNVLQHYFPVNHDIVDKFEEAKGVINQDITEYQPDKKYDLIISISTLEHIGYDEKLRDNTKISRTIEKLKGLLSEGGKIIVTLPMGYNLELDNLLRLGRMQFARQFCLRRISKDNVWKEVDWREICFFKIWRTFSRC